VVGLGGGGGAGGWGRGGGGGGGGEAKTFFLPWRGLARDGREFKDVEYGDSTILNKHFIIHS